MGDKSSGVLSAMSSMVNIEIPWINILSKMDLVTAPKKTAEQDDLDDSEEKRDGPGPLNGKRGRRNIAKYVHVLFPFVATDLNPGEPYRFLDPDPMMLIASEPTGGSKSNPRFHQLNQAIAQLVRITLIFSTFLVVGAEPTLSVDRGSSSCTVSPT